MVTELYYTLLLENLKIEIIKKNRLYLKKKESTVLPFHQDNAPAHTSEGEISRV